MKDGFVKLAAVAPPLRVADVRHNVAGIAAAAREAAARGARIFLTPELSLTGYTCGDLFLQESLLNAAEEGLLALAHETEGLGLLLAVGLPLRKDGKLYNCAALLCGGAVLGVVPKANLPGYGPHNEGRWFAPAPAASCETLALGGSDVPFGRGLIFRSDMTPALCVGVELCEDLWVPEPPSAALCGMGASIILNLCASPEIGREADYRRDLVRMQSGRCHCIYAMSVAGEGESTTDLVFSGHQMIAVNGEMLDEAAPFGTGLAIADVDVQAMLYERRRLTSYPAAGGGCEVRFSLAPTQTAFERPVGRQPFMPDDLDARAAYCSRLLSVQSHALMRRLSHTGAARAVLGVSGGLDSTLTLLALCKAMDGLSRPHSDILAVTMPGFGTSGRTRGNAEKMCEALGVELRCIPIGPAVEQHFADIGHDLGVRNTTFENAQARERTQVLMDLANDVSGMVIGTGDLSELALGWATYNGDHMSMYGVNGGMPKTVIRLVVGYYADTCGDEELAAVLRDVLDTPVSPELLPTDEQGGIGQKTEDLVGPYELHDFFIWYAIRWGFAPAKIARLARSAFAGTYDDATILKWLRNFYTRFFAMQFKRSCMPDGPATTELGFSPRGAWVMPSDAMRTVWQAELDALE